MYALLDENRNVFYVGRTRKPLQRRYAHRKTFGQGTQLRIVQNTFSVEESPADAERKWIRHYLGCGVNLVNVVIPVDRPLSQYEAAGSRFSPEALTYFREAGRMGGKIGASRLAQMMTPEQRSERGRNAAEARWNKGA